MDPADLAADPVVAFWDDLLADASATAGEYEREGWAAMELHPGDVTPLDGEYGDRIGLDVLVPDNEFEDVEDWFDEGFSVDEYEVYRSAVMGTVFLLVALRDADAERAVLLPAFYRREGDGVSGMFQHANDQGALHVYVRRLSGEYAEFRLDDPGLFAPPPEDEGDGSSGDGDGGSDGEGGGSEGEAEGSEDGVAGDDAT